jgi:hypothetical protein
VQCHTKPKEGKDLRDVYGRNSILNKGIPALEPDHISILYLKSRTSIHFNFVLHVTRPRPEAIDAVVARTKSDFEGRLDDMDEKHSNPWSFWFGK